MAITQAVCASFKTQVLSGIHDLESGGDTFYMSLYTSAATLNGVVTASYTTASQVSDSGQYVAGGGVLAGQQVSLSVTTAIVDLQIVHGPVLQSPLGAR